MQKHTYSHCIFPPFYYWPVCIFFYSSAFQHFSPCCISLNNPFTYHPNGQVSRPPVASPASYSTPSRLVSPCLGDSPQGSQLFWKGIFCVSALLIKPKHTHGTRRRNKNGKKGNPFFRSFLGLCFGNVRPEELLQDL